MASSSSISRFTDLVSVNEFPEGHGNENNRKNTKEYRFIEGLFDAKKWVTSPEEISAIRTRFIHSRIHKWENNENYTEEVHFNQSVARCITGKKMKQNLLHSGTKDYEY